MKIAGKPDQYTSYDQDVEKRHLLLIVTTVGAMQFLEETGHIIYIKSTRVR